MEVFNWFSSYELNCGKFSVVAAFIFINPWSWSVHARRGAAVAGCWREGTAPPSLNRNAVQELAASPFFLFFSLLPANHPDSPDFKTWESTTKPLTFSYLCLYLLFHIAYSQQFIHSTVIVLASQTGRVRYHSSPIRRSCIKVRNRQKIKSFLLLLYLNII